MPSTAQLAARLKVAEDRLRHKLKVTRDQLTTTETQLNTLTLEVNLRQLKKCYERANSITTEYTVAIEAQTDATATEAFEKLLPDLETLYIEVEDTIEEVAAVRDHHDNKERYDYHDSKERLDEKSVTFTNRTIKLPKLPTPVFNGDVTRYQEFKQSFEATVEASDLSGAQKLTYLKEMLVDNAKNDLKGLTSTNENYEIARKMLDEKYGDSKRAIQLLYQKLTQLPAAKNNTIEQLRSTYDEMEVLLRTLESYGESFDNNTILFTTLVQKFPQDIVYEIHNGVTEVLNLREFRQKMKSLVQKREQLNFDAPKEEELALYTTESLAISTRKRFTKKCIFCAAETHWSDECDKFTTIETRKEQIKGRCFICLRKNHSVKQCTEERTCVHCGQKKNHHRSLCTKLLKQKTSMPNTPQPGEQEASSTTVSCLLSSKEDTWLLTAIAKISNPVNNQEHHARLVLDAGSKRSYITTTTAEHMKLPHETNELLRIDTFGNNNRHQTTSKVVQFRVHLNNGDAPITIEANTVPKIIDGIETFNPAQLSDQSILKNKKLADTSTRLDVEILIGIDYLFDFLTSEQIKIGEHQYLINSKLGWLFAGKVPINNKKNNRTKCLLLKEANTQTKDDLKNLWELDIIGIREKPDIDDEQALKLFNETITYNKAEKRYEVTWPWIDDSPNLRPNYGLAVGRLESLLKQHNDEYTSKYHDIIQDYVNQNIIEEVDDTIATNNLIQYMPHHGVRTTSKSTPLRVVFDGSAKSSKNDKSLNDCIYKGKNFNEDIAKLLLNFQMYEIGIIADIKKAFLQITLSENERDAVRFLWLRDRNLQTTTNNLAVYRFRRIPFGVNASPFLLAATIRYHLSKYPEQLAAKLQTEFYVDNLISGADTIQEATEFISSTVDIFADASMTLSQWQTNRKELAELHKDLEWIPDDVVSVLGTNWNSHTDTLSIKAAMLTNSESIVTKRSILKDSAKVYDRLGYFSPVTLNAKLILRQLWEEHYDWDDQLPEDLVRQWKELLSELRKIHNFEIPRKCLSVRDNYLSIQLHVFTDASKSAYGLAVYIRIKYETNCKVQLVFAKARVAPLKEPLKIPRLELIAALVGSRSIKFVHDSLHRFRFNEMILWTDSTCVINWINSTKLLTPFVERRVAEIRQIKQLTIRYVKSEDNPADIASRGSNLDGLSTIWWKGPDWLAEKESEWPSMNIEVTKTNSTEEETQKGDTNILITNTPKPNPPFDITVSEFEELSELLHETSHRMAQTQINATISAAKQIWIEYVQRSHFTDVFDGIANGKPTNLEKQLNIYVDQSGILRVKGRLLNILQTSQQEEDFPILLPNNDYFVKLLILHTHQQLYHAGTSQTLAEIRKTFWLTRGRATVYHTIRKCKNCQIYNAPAYRYPKVPPLPGYRIKRQNAFAFVGIDVLGPLYVRRQKRSGTKKNWILLFSCLVTRAVHLEVLEELTTEEILAGLRQAFARRGIPQFILSDNAPQFIVLKTLAEGKNYLTSQDIQWKLVPAFSPWAGGVYERMVALVKNALKRTFYHVTLTRRQLQTATAEIEAIINSRPIAYVGAEDNFVLSPRDLLNIPWNIPEDFDPTTSNKIIQDIVTNWKNGRQQVDAFWRVWRNDYVEGLRHSQGKKSTARSENKVPKIADTVLINDKNLPRGRWKVGKITALNYSEDGAIRSAVVEVQTGRQVTRPVCMLHPIETDIDRDDVRPQTQSAPEDERQVPRLGRRQRPAAAAARVTIRKWIADL